MGSLLLCGGLLCSVGLLPTSAAAAPMTAGRTEAVVERDGDLVISHVRLYDPLPPGSAPHPADCDFIDYLRYRTARGPTDPEAADAVLLSEAGAFFGGYSMDRLARNTVSAMAARGTTAEWWSQPRRSTCAFDTFGLAEANRMHDPSLAFDYYYGGKEVAGRRFAGFRPDSELRYLADFGLARNVADMRTVLDRELPDPKVRRAKAFCGGTSDGGLIVGAFAAWDFGGGPENAGYNHCAGFFAIDSVINSDILSLQSVPFVSAAAKLVGALPYLAAVAGLQAGILPVSYNGIPFVEPQFMTLLSVLGSAAYHAPDAESDLHHRIPATWQNELATRGAFASSYADFVSGANALRDFRFTNAALLGVLLGDHTFNFSPLQFSIGALAGGPVADKEFPWRDSAVKSIPVLGPWLTHAATGPGPRVGPTDHTALYTWRDYDNVEDIPFTSPDSEVVSIHDLARMLAGAPGGPTGFLDPYFTTRYATDLQGAYTGARVGDLAAMRYDAMVKTRPVLTVFGTKSWTLVTDGAIAGIPADTVYAPGYTHTDVIAGAARQNNGRPEVISQTIADFVRQHLGPH